MDQKVSTTVLMMTKRIIADKIAKACEIHKKDMLPSEFLGILVDFWNNHHFKLPVEDIEVIIPDSDNDDLVFNNFDF